MIYTLYMLRLNKSKSLRPSEECKALAHVMIKNIPELTTKNEFFDFYLVRLFSPGQSEPVRTIGDRTIE